MSELQVIGAGEELAAVALERRPQVEEEAGGDHARHAPAGRPPGAPPRGPESSPSRGHGRSRGTAGTARCRTRSQRPRPAGPGARSPRMSSERRREPRGPGWGGRSFGGRRRCCAGGAERGSRPQCAHASRRVGSRPGPPTRRRHAVDLHWRCPPRGYPGPGTPVPPASRHAGAHARAAPPRAPPPCARGRSATAFLRSASPPERAASHPSSRCAAARESSLPGRRAARPSGW